MAIKTMSVSSGGGQWTEGWHTLTISKAEYGDWNGTRVLDLYFEDYPETFNHRIFEAFDKETHEEYSLAKFFKLCNAGLIDKIKSPFETLSPTFTFNFSIIPCPVEGTSTLDLSLSNVIKESFFLICCPSLTRTSITSTSLKSPISGTKIFVLAIVIS